MSLTLYNIISAVLCFLAASAFIFIRLKKGVGKASIITKVVASFLILVSIIVYFFIGHPSSKSFTFTLCVGIGVFFSIAGDYLLERKEQHNKNENIFLKTGIGAFCLAQISFLTGMIFFLSRRHEIPWVFFLLLGIGILFGIGVSFASKYLLHFDHGKDFILSTVYAALLAGVGFMAIPTIFYFRESFPYFLIPGFVLFMASDFILSLIYYSKKDAGKLLHGINLGSYYLAQILIMLAATSFVGLA